MARMRIAVAAVAAALPACAAQAQEPAPFGLWARTPAAIAPAVLALGEGLRLRVGIVERRRRSLVDGIDLPMRRRLLSAMVDYFPLGGNSGFHVSGGTLRAPRPRMGVEAAWLNPGKLVLTRVPGNGGFGGNTRRATPALTMGYSLSPLRNFDLGIEVGEAFGRINSMAPGAGAARLADMAGDRAGDGDSRLNPVVHLALGMRF